MKKTPEIPEEAIFPPSPLLVASLKGGLFFPLHIVMQILFRVVAEVRARHDVRAAPPSRIAGKQDGGLMLNN